MEEIQDVKERHTGLVQEKIVVYYLFLVTGVNTILFSVTNEGGPVGLLYLIEIISKI